MKVALCTTTINVPHVLKLYRACDRDVKFFIAPDRKTMPEAYATFKEVGAEISTGNGRKCTDLIGFDSIQRRNLAFLDALAWGAEVIVSIDDDNIPLSQNYFDIATMYAWQRSGIRTDPKQKWFDPGLLLIPPTKHRGFPRQPITEFWFDPAVDAKIGVHAGLCLGDPDVDAVTRIERHPVVLQVSTVGDAGVLVHPNTWTVFNSQNTAILAELLPAWGMIPFVGRMDDIYASLICQRVMRERNLHVHFGKPFVWQQRNEHNLIKDLRGEIDGYENVERLAEVLDHMVLAGKSVIDDTRRIWETLNHADWMPGRSVSAMMAYIDDCESVLVKEPA